MVTVLLSRVHFADASENLQKKISISVINHALLGFRQWHGIAGVTIRTVHAALDPRHLRFTPP